jgi:Protein of unknown function (DUF1566)
MTLRLARTPHVLCTSTLLATMASASLGCLNDWAHNRRDSGSDGDATLAAGDDAARDDGAAETGETDASASVHDGGPTESDSSVDSPSATEDSERPVRTGCAEANECSATYPCTETSTGYTCLGRFADWPMPDARVDSAVKPNYTTPIPGIFEDTVTGLQWQSSLLFENMTWHEAKSRCEQLALAGAGWRMPSFIELFSLVNHDAGPPLQDLLLVGAGASIDGYGAYLWTITPAPSMPGQFQVVNFADGHSSGRDESTLISVRCVRSPNAQGDVLHRYDTSEQGSVLDRMTGLRWERNVDQAKFSPGQAVPVCASHGAGWRMPTVKELATLLDLEHGAPWIVEPLVNDTPLGQYWSTVPNTTGTISGKWGVDFENGWLFKAIAVGREPPTAYVRCVQ